MTKTEPDLRAGAPLLSPPNRHRAGAPVGKTSKNDTACAWTGRLTPFYGEPKGI